MEQTDAISRSSAISDLREWLYGSPDDEFQEGFDSALLGAIDRLGNENINPALDVAPVVHARWIMNHFGAKCSNCLRLYCVEPSWSEKIKHMPPTWIYCPNCGARMDGEENG